jgi:hypothetical protein
VRRRHSSVVEQLFPKSPAPCAVLPCLAGLYKPAHLSAIRFLGFVRIGSTLTAPSVQSDPRYPKPTEQPGLVAMAWAPGTRSHGVLPDVNQSPLVTHGTQVILLDPSDAVQIVWRPDPSLLATSIWPRSRSATNRPSGDQVMSSIPEPGRAVAVQPLV